MNIYVDSRLSDDQRRSELYRGSIFSQASAPSAPKLCQLAQQMLEQAFAPIDPMRVHLEVPAEKCVEILGLLKPKFIHHPLSKQYIQGMLSEAGCDLSQTYFDVPRLRCTGTTMGDYLRGTDLAGLPADAIAPYQDGTELQYAKA